MEKNLIFLSLVISFLFQAIYAEPINLELGKNQTGTVEGAKSAAYFQTKIVNYTGLNDTIINVWSKNLLTYCDPDIYVSTVNTIFKLEKSKTKLDRLSIYLNFIWIR